MINFLPRLISGILYILIIFTSIIISKESFLLVFSIITLVVSYEAYLLSKKMKKNGFKVKYILTPHLYVFISMIALIYIPFAHSLTYDPYKILLIFLMIWITDTMSYFFGSYFGKNKLDFKASPNKTWEGLLGGIFCSLIFSIVSFLFIKEVYPFWKTILLGITIPVFGLFGDIQQSEIKRAAGVKDSGNLIPGHGGMFDRLDSAIGNSFIILIITIL
ncbi:MAG: phosphatidate cytidylyltransferase [Bacteroidota bacterium]